MERFRQEVADETFTAPDGTTHSVTISIGLASLDKRLVDETELLAEADKALYQSKAQGKNQTNSYEH